MFPNERSAETLAAAVLLRVSEDRSQRKYLDMAPFHAFFHESTRFAPDPPLDLFACVIRLDFVQLRKAHRAVWAGSEPHVQVYSRAETCVEGRTWPCVLNCRFFASSKWLNWS